MKEPRCEYIKIKSGTQCKLQAKWTCINMKLCTRHSDKSSREPLEKTYLVSAGNITIGYNPRTSANCINVTLYNMMMQNAMLLPGLSSSCLGPISHSHPTLPIVPSLRNFWYGNMVQESDINEHGLKTEFYNRQRLYYESKSYQLPIMNPIMWITVSASGLITYYNMHDARLIYCSYYEALISDKFEYKQLVQLNNQGKCIHICGGKGYIHDNFELILKNMALADFSDEFILYVMLSRARGNRPWNVHK